MINFSNVSKKYNDYVALNNVSFVIEGDEFVSIVGLGTGAGYSNTTGTGNTFLGYGADTTIGTLYNATAIGYKTLVSASNSLVLGSGANVGIGRSSPKTRLEVAGTISGTTLTVSDLKSCAMVVTKRMVSLLVVLL
jgi:energy-coupling factor transporter ATP-binding protein EcfA2